MGRLRLIVAITVMTAIALVASTAAYPEHGEHHDVPEVEHPAPFVPVHDEHHDVPEVQHPAPSVPAHDEHHDVPEVEHPAPFVPVHGEHHDVPEVEHPAPFVPVPHAETDEHIQYLGKFAVERLDEQTHAYLKFIQVTEAEILDRGTEHYTYHLLLKVHDGHDFKLYKCEVFQDLSGYEEPPVLNLGYFEPL